MTNAEAWFNNSLRPRKPEGSLGRTAQDGHLDSHTAPELCAWMASCIRPNYTPPQSCSHLVDRVKRLQGLTELRLGLAGLMMMIMTMMMTMMRSLMSSDVGLTY